MPEETIKVAVRCRPFNQREKNLNANLIISMEGSETTITNLEDPQKTSKTFTFDHSYWSHDGFFEKEDGYLEASPNSPYASQHKVFTHIGQSLIDSALEGYNCSLFAYGNTGSGKSYSMIGYGPNKGIVPMTCDELFKTMAANSDNKKFRVTFSMLEIYNEQVTDLLTDSKTKGGLKIRQDPKKGIFFVEGLKHFPVESYEEIENYLRQGTANRIITSTNMNASSSRSHTIFGITFEQIITSEAGSKIQKKILMNLVDLAGSERQTKTGTSGDRLREGAKINASLSVLGNVISALAEKSSNPSKSKRIVPYRDSALTKLLRDALGGNSKTIMIAAISPADVNYDETLSTLRYADRVKKIKNTYVAMEIDLTKLISELKDENNRLQKAIQDLDVIQTTGKSPEEIEQVKEMEKNTKTQLLANEKLLIEHESHIDWEKKLPDRIKSREKNKSKNTDMVKEATLQESSELRKEKEPYFINLNEDPMLSGVVSYFFEKEKTIIGRSDGNADICLVGLSIEKKHAVITNKNGKISIEPVPESGSQTKINGFPLDGYKQLGHRDRVLFGSNNMFIFMNPLDPDTNDESLPSAINWEFAQWEIAQANGFYTSNQGLTKNQKAAQDHVLEILPMVSEINAISEELNKHRHFEVVLVSALTQEDKAQDQSTMVKIKMTNLINKNTWLWEQDKFLHRRYLIQEMYQQYRDGEDLSKISKEKDPFWEPPEDVLIGTATAYLMSMSYRLDFEEQLSIIDYKGQQVGSIKIFIQPCDTKWKELQEDDFVEDPIELLNKPLNFKVLVKDADIKKSQFAKGIRVHYKVFVNNSIVVNTPIINNTMTPVFNHAQLVSIPKVTQEHLDYFEKGTIMFHVYGIQEETVSDIKLAAMTTKELRAMNNMKEIMDSNVFLKNLFENEIASDKSNLKAEITQLQRKYDCLAYKQKKVQEICKEWKKKPIGEQVFEPFFEAVFAAATGTNTLLSTGLNLLNKRRKVVDSTEPEQVVQTKTDEPERNLTSQSPDIASAEKTQVKKETTEESSKMAQSVNNSHELRRQNTVDLAMLTKIKVGSKQMRPSSAGGKTNNQEASKACLLQ